MPRAGSWTALFLLVLLASWAAREGRSARFHRLPADGGPTLEEWFSVEPDGLYHVRRVERALSEGLPPAAEDPLLSFPEGAAIPWPPYYDALLGVVLRPVVGAPPDGDGARRAWRARLERAAATLPLWFGVGVSLLVAAAGAALAGRAGALAAGLLHALSFGAVQYAVPGIADHHAFVGLLLVALLLVVGEALRRGALARAASGLRFGAAAGILAGMLLGSWVASLVHVLVVQAVLGLLVLRDSRRAETAPGLAPFGLAFHAAALLAVMPAVLQSPWASSHPWMVVNLSWFHPALLLLGGLVFLPLPRLGPAARRAHPFVVLALLGALGAVLLLGGGAAGAGLREGFEWAARANAFMGDIAESQPLLGEDRFGTGGLFGWLGWGVLLAPLAWGAGALALRRQPALLPWLVALPVFLAQALAQRRFAESAAVPLAVLLGWALVELLRRCRLPEPARLALPAVAAVLLQLPGAQASWAGWRDRDELARDAEAVRQNGLRAAHEWLGAHAVPDAAVMAHWDQGHAIELLTGMGSVATNFGSYVGETGFVDAAAFLTSGDFEAAEFLLERSAARFVLVHSGAIHAWPQLRRVAERPEAAWPTSMAGTLFRPDAEDGPDFLRLRWVSPFPELDPHPKLLPGVPMAPAALVYERVAGVRLAVGAPAGSEVALELPVELPGGGAAFALRRRAVAGADGVARFRLPYPGTARVRVAGEETAREVVLPEAAVASGGTVELR